MMDERKVEVRRSEEVSSRVEAKVVEPVTAAAVAELVGVEESCSAATLCRPIARE